MLRGSHPIRFWSRTQSSVALSSAEAELVAIVKTMTEAIGLEVMAREAGLKTLTTTVLTDASAAHGIVHRLGSGRLKHIQISSLWIQERVARGETVVRKIGRESNCADLLTHQWAPSKVEALLMRMGMRTKAPQ